MKGIVLVGLVLLTHYALSQSYSVSGTVMDRNHKPMAGALVEVLNTNLQAITGPGGAFVLGPLDPGSFEVRITAPGNATRIISLLVPRSEPLQLSLEEETRVLDEVVVRTEKREEPLQRSSVSVSALSEAELSDYRLWNLTGLTAIVPALYTADPGDNRNVTSIRGITSTSYDPAVVTYIDGVNQFNLDTYMPELFDVESIEVLRGPQSTLYGRNALGGVINVTTRRPSFRTTAFGEASVGSYGLQRYRAGLKTPLSAKWFAGAALLYNRLAGFYTNEATRTRYDRQVAIGGNYSLRFLPSARLSATLNIKHQFGTNNGPFPLVFGATAAVQHPYRLAQDAVAEMQDRLFNTSLALKYFAPRYTLTSETGYQSNHRIYEGALDADFSPLDAMSIFNDYGRDWNHVRVLTQELRVTSPAAKSVRSTRWVGGIYGFYQRSPVKQATVFGKEAGMMGTPDSLFRLLNTSTAKNWGLAFFGQLTVPLTARLQLTGGLRYDYQHSGLAVRSDYLRDDRSFGFPVRPDTAARTSYSALSPRLGMAFRFNERQQVYAHYSRGFRTGGLTQLSADPSQPALYPFAPEYSNHFELGAKNTFAGNRLRLNGAIFYVRVNDIQVPELVLPDAITITRNGGRLTSKGVEAEAAARILQRLQVQYSFGYTHAEYTRLKLPRDGTDADYSGNRQIFTPEVTSLLAAQYKLPLYKKRQLDAVVRGEWFYIGEQYFDQRNTIRQHPYHLLHMRAGGRTPKAELAFWLRNITRTKYIDYAYDFGGVHLGDPQTYGLTFSVKI